MKRCCETCRFFEKGTLAGSGWCRHPERVEATSDLVLVRASQLTCRKGWDKDFWEPIARNGRSVDRIHRGAQLGPVPPASPEDIDAIINAGKASDEERAAATAAIEEDRVVGAAPSPLTHVPKSLITKHLPPAPEQAPPLSGAGDGPNTREKILIAKEEVARKRITNRIRTSVEPLASPAVLPVPHTSDSGDTAEPVDHIAAEPEVVSEEIVETVADDNTNLASDEQPALHEDRPRLPLEALPSTNGWDHEPLVPSIPPTFDHWNYPTDRHPPFLWLVQGVSSGRSAGGSAAEVDTASSYDGKSDDVVAQRNTQVDDQPFELPPPIDTTFLPPSAPGQEKRRPRRQRGYAPFRSRWSDARERPRRQAPPLPPVWADAPDVADDPILPEESLWTDAALPEDTVLPTLDEREAGIPLLHVDEQPLPLVIREDPTGWDEAVDAAWPATLPGSAGNVDSDAGEDHAVPIPATAWTVQETANLPAFDDVVVHSNGIGPILYDPEVDEYVLAPDVPRMCRTCAAFRPADGGERGWCSNGWAFNNRLLVSAWDVPCQTSFGNWWIPNDDYWNDGTFARLNAPAPLFDQLMAQRIPPRREKPTARKRWS